MQQPETLSDLINFVSFGHLFCQDLDLAILLHQDVHLAQTELYQMDLLDGIACATKAFLDQAAFELRCSSPKPCLI